MLAPVHATRVNEAIGRIHAAGVPLFGFVNPIPSVPCVSYVDANDYALGFALAQYLYVHLEGRGKVLVVSGPLASVTSIDHVRAFADAAKSFPGISIAGSCVGDYRRDTARNSVAQWLAANGDVDACLAANDIMAVGVVDAWQKEGRNARRLPAIASVNAIPEAIAAIRRGEMLATVDFNAMHMAYLATECAVRHLRGEPVPAQIQLPAQIVDRHNYESWDLPYERRPIPTLKEILA